MNFTSSHITKENEIGAITYGRGRTIKGKFDNWRDNIEWFGTATTDGTSCDVLAFRFV